MKELRDRIGSVKNTKKITDAMKLVAAAKVRRAQDSVVRGRPFSENLVKVNISLASHVVRYNIFHIWVCARPRCHALRLRIGRRLVPVPRFPESMLASAGMPSAQSRLDCTKNMLLLSNSVHYKTFVLLAFFEYVSQAPVGRVFARDVRVRPHISKLHFLFVLKKLDPPHTDGINPEEFGVVSLEHTHHVRERKLSMLQHLVGSRSGSDQEGAWSTILVHFCVAVHHPYLCASCRSV
jgi:ferredoxin